MSNTTTGNVDEPFAPQVPRRLGRCRRRAGAGLSAAVRHRAGDAQGKATAAPEVNAWVVVKPDDTCVDPHRALRDGPGHADRSRATRRRGTRVRLEESDDGVADARPEPRAQARLGRDRHRRQPRHPHIGGLCAPRWRCGADDAAAGGGQPVAGSGRANSTVANGVITHAASKRRTTYGKVAAAAAKLTAAGPEEHQAQGSEGLEDRRQAVQRLDTAPKAQWQPDLRDRRHAAGHAVRRDQGLPGVRRQARRASTNREDRRPIPVPARGQGERRHCRRGRGHVVESEVRARPSADRLGRRPGRGADERDDCGAPQGRPDDGRRVRLAAGRRRAQGHRGAPRRRSTRSTARRSSRTRRWSR